jgi:hypothetical protein
VEEANGAGIGAAAGQDLPQGAAPFIGPGGMAMEATAEEFIQRVTLQDGTVLRTSGVGIFAVPGASAVNAVIDRVGFGAANTGSLASVTTGSYAIAPPVPINFIDQIRLAHASVRRTGERDRDFADDGTVVLASLEYFDDVYTCELKTAGSLVIDTCEYQVGIVSGSIEFSATLGDGTAVVQERTSFTLPIRRRTIIAHLR